MDRFGEIALREDRESKSFTNEGLNEHTELPKWTRVSQRINPPGF